MKPMTTAPALLAALALTATLAACSGGNDTANPGGTGGNPALSETFDWSRASHGPVQKIAFAFPDELTAIAPELANLTAAPVSATARELDSAKYCAIDIAYDLPQGVEAVAGEAGMSEDELRNEAAIRAWGQYGKFQGEGVTNADEQREWLVEQATENIRRIEENTGIKQDVEGGVATEMELADRAFEERLEELRQAQGSKQALTEGQRLFYASSKPVEELDSADPEPGNYYSANLEKLTIVHSCAADPLDASNSERGVIPVRTSDDGEHAFASAHITSTKNGDLYLFEAEVRNYETDSNGDWIAG